MFVVLLHTCFNPAVIAAISNKLFVFCITLSSEGARPALQGGDGPDVRG